jgi:mono/diheme cytochrome c family protein
MISPRMSRSVRVLLLSSTSIAVAALAAACGTERISVPKSRPILYQGAVLFSQRCSGCHTLSYAATHGSAPNVRTAMAISGPNFNVRCERPITRVLYAIENGGFSGAYMPQNIVVGQNARDVAEFVSTYAGRAAPKEPGTPPCMTRAIGTLPPPVSATAAALISTTSSSTTTAAAAPAKKPAKANKKKTAHT